MENSNVNSNLLKYLQIEHLFKIIQKQSEEIELQKIQINALIKSQQSLLESMKPPSGISSYLNSPTLDINSKSLQNTIGSNLLQHSQNVSNTNIDLPDHFLYDYNHHLNQHVVFNSPLKICTPNSVKKSTNKDLGNVANYLNAVPGSESKPNDNWSSSKLVESTEAQTIIKKEVADQSDNVNVTETPVIEVDANEDDEEMNLSSLQEFAAKFKMSRIEMGFTQRDVGICLGLMQGNDFSQTTLSRFEALNLSYRNMRKLQPLLQRWLDDIQREGRDTVMGRITEFYQQQKAMVDEEVEELSTVSVSSKKRVANESLIMPDDLPDESNTANADSTSTNTKLLRISHKTTNNCALSSRLSPTVHPTGWSSGIVTSFWNTLSANLNGGNHITSFSNPAPPLTQLVQSSNLQDPSTTRCTRNLFSSKRRRKRIVLTEDGKVGLDLFPENAKDPDHNDI